MNEETTNDNDKPAEFDEVAAYEATRNYRVGKAMDGMLVAGPSEVADEIINLLRSNHELTRETRDKLADAFERGRAGNRPRIDDPHDVRPYIAVAGGGNRARLAKCVLKRRQWFDAADEIDQAAKRGDKSDQTRASICKEHKITLATFHKDARPFFCGFLTEFEDPESHLNKIVLSEFVATDYQADDWFYMARMFYIEREAERELGIALADYGG